MLLDPKDLTSIFAVLIAGSNPFNRRIVPPSLALLLVAIGGDRKWVRGNPFFQFQLSFESTGRWKDEISRRKDSRNLGFQEADRPVSRSTKSRGPSRNLKNGNIEGKWGVFAPEIFARRASVSADCTILRFAVGCHWIGREAFVEVPSTGIRTLFSPPFARTIAYHPRSRRLQPCYQFVPVCVDEARNPEGFPGKETRCCSTARLTLKSADT